ncbi:MAG: GNAT family N-acetyltransferase [Armatimonadota bacterium]|nr:MAG: GNAT family N-acetyltransferase [Armatimonadota bacterium]
MEDSGLLIRPAEARDVPALAELMGELGYPITVEDMRDRLDFAASSGDDELFVAESDGRAVGLIGIQVSDFVHRVARYGRITALVVAAGYRRRGVAAALLKHTEAFLAARGIADVRVDAGSHRKEEAHRFYQAQGYAATGVRFTKKLKAGNGGG